MVIRSPIVRHLGVPSLFSVALIGLAYVPKSTFGCANRGWIAIALVAVALAGSVAALIRGARLRGTDTAASLWWLLTSFVLLLPALLLLRLG
jgi:hypothetical protein